MLIKLMAIFMWLAVTPFCCGLSITRYMRKKYQNLSMILVTGYFLMLALFQIIYILFVVFYNHFKPLVVVYGVGIAALSVISLACNGKYWIKQHQKIEKVSWTTVVLWLIAFGLVGFQLYKTIFYQFHDGDDALYAVHSVITWQNNNMYMRTAYTGESSVLDVRHAFSAAPVFISFLAGASGIHPTIVTHVLYASAVLLLFYLLIKLIADILVEKQYVPIFLIFVSLMNLFGNDNIYMSSTFLLTRTSQGKAFLGNIIPAAAILGLLLVWRNLKESDSKVTVNQTNSFVPWILLSCVMITAVYTSLMGLMLAALLIGGTTVLLACFYKKPKLLIPCILSMVPLFVIGLLYVKLLI
ncbi:MAG: DUF6077 domain-containing protein [Lachnospiraceae bacterium]|nr:DUF6077 domain-containing protein [Lachnospiraceae bacterium]